MARKKKKQAETIEENEVLEEVAISESDSENEESSEDSLLEQEIERLNDKHLRLLAEFENFKRRTAKERIELQKLASKSMILDILPVVDDFERGLENMKSAEDVKSLEDGVNLIYQKLLGVLGQKGLSAIETIGEEFDPEIHEAISRLPAEGKNKKNTIVAEIEKGYRLNDHVIRFSKVVVAI